VQFVFFKNQVKAVVNHSAGLRG